MSDKIVQLNEEVIKGQLKELVRGSVEETLNELLEAEAEKLTQAARYERNEQRQGYRSGHYSRNLTTTSGDVTSRFLNSRGSPLRPPLHLTCFAKQNLCQPGRLHKALKKYAFDALPIQYSVNVDNLQRAKGWKISPVPLLFLAPGEYINAAENTKVRPFP